MFVVEMNYLCARLSNIRALLFFVGLSHSSGFFPFSSIVYAYMEKSNFYLRIEKETRCSGGPIKKTQQQQQYKQYVFGSVVGIWEIEKKGRTAYTTKATFSFSCNFKNN